MKLIPKKEKDLILWLIFKISDYNEKNSNLPQTTTLFHKIFFQLYENDFPLLELDFDYSCILGHYSEKLQYIIETGLITGTLIRKYNSNNVLYRNDINLSSFGKEYVQQISFNFEQKIISKNNMNILLDKILNNKTEINLIITSLEKSPKPIFQFYDSFTFFAMLLNLNKFDPQNIMQKLVSTVNSTKDYIKISKVDRKENYFSCDIEFLPDYIQEWYEKYNLNDNVYNPDMIDFQSVLSKKHQLILYDDGIIIITISGTENKFYHELSQHYLKICRFIRLQLQKEYVFTAKNAATDLKLASGIMYYTAGTHICLSDLFLESCDRINLIKNDLIDLTGGTITKLLRILDSPIAFLRILINRDKQSFMKNLSRFRARTQRTVTNFIITKKALENMGNQCHVGTTNQAYEQLSDKVDEDLIAFQELAKYADSANGAFVQFVTMTSLFLAVFGIGGSLIVTSFKPDMSAVIFLQEPTVLVGLLLIGAGFVGLKRIGITHSIKLPIRTLAKIMNLDDILH